MKKNPMISIIIPVYVLTDYFYESLEKCLELNYPNYEILIGVDSGIKIPYKSKKIRVLKTNKSRTGPAEKRDIGIRRAKGEIIAFLDDDSYPHKDWLKKAASVMAKKKVSSVCGPGLTPPADSFSQKITGAILESPLGSGPYSYRFAKRESRFVDDYPAYNMFVKRDVLIRVGGFGTKFYGGEDTAICIKLTNAGEKIFYDPRIVVYHHRRRFPFEYLKQVGNVGMHRGYFVKKYPQTSLRFTYFGPAILTIFIFCLTVFITINVQTEVLFFLLLIFVATYVFVFLVSFIQSPFLISLILPFAILLHHFEYGLQFLRGLFLIDKMER